ncbi:MAG: NuoM family protein [Anaerolineae bacterium]
MNFPLLSVIIFAPAVTAVLILLLPKDRQTEPKVLAAAGSFISLALAIWGFLAYDRGAGGYQFVEQAPWIPAIGSSYHVGVNGMGVMLVLLNGLLLFSAVLISWHIDDRPREFFALLLLMGVGVFGAFTMLDLFLLVLFYELVLFPIYILIVTWGWKPLREYGAMKLTLYLLLGSLVSLVGILAIYFTSGLGTFDMVALEGVGFSPAFQRIWFLPIFMGFAVLASIWPFYSWSPDGYAAAPTAVSMLHAGVLKNVGAFTAFRVAVLLLPEGAQFWMPYLVFLMVVNVIYATFIALVHTDFKYIIGFASVAHMGIVLMGFAALNELGWSGAVTQMFAHGIIAAMSFAIVGMVYDRTHNREIKELGGMVRRLPQPAIAFIVAGLASMGMPGLLGFIAEVQVFLGLWRAADLAPWYPVVAIVSAVGILGTAAYILRALQYVFFGALKPKYADVPPVSPLDKVALVMLSTVLIVGGLFPALITPLIRSGVESVLALLGGA